MPHRRGNLHELSRLWRADVYRHTSRTDTPTLVKTWFAVPCFRYSAVMRACAALTAGRGRVAHVVGLLVLRRFQRRWGISIPSETSIGAGFYIGHSGGIVVNPRARIGRNCNIHQGVTIAQANRGPREGAPVIGDGVWIGPGATLVGAITIGDNVVIGPNSVVIDDVPADAVVASPRALIVSETHGAERYIEFTI
jgi:serine O-acetyltransferase